MDDKVNWAFIDADSIYFRAAFVTKKQNELRKAIDTTMKDIEAKVMSQHFENVDFMVAVKGRGNFRKDLYPDYKKNRKPQPEEMKEALNYGHSYMVEKYNAVQADGMEADDLVSIWAHEARHRGEQYTVVGIDKDLLQIPGNHYNFNRKEFVDVDDDTANLNLMLQCLTGDNTDNIPGIKGVGPKRASTILSGCPMVRRWNRVRAAWRSHNAGKPELSRRLLEMLVSWEEFEDVKREVASKTSIRKQDVLPEQEQDGGISGVSE